LIVGVLALLTAAGFFLKYAIDRGWIAPLVRSLLAIAAGVGVAAWGEARIRGGLRRYGAAMIGAGGGLVYLGLWAAAGPYGLLERRIGVLLLAACTVAVTLLALRHEIEGLAIWALAGAYMAPILLSPHVPNPEAFLGYLEVIGLGTGLLAYTMTWRRTFNLALAGYVLLAAAGAATALSARSAAGSSRRARCSPCTSPGGAPGLRREWGCCCSHGSSSPWRSPVCATGPKRGSGSPSGRRLPSQASCGGSSWSRVGSGPRWKRCCSARTPSCYSPWCGRLIRRCATGRRRSCPRCWRHRTSASNTK